MPDTWQDFLLLDGWFAWYRWNGKPVGDRNFCLRRPLVGVAVYREQGTNAIVSLVGMVYTAAPPPNAVIPIRDYRAGELTLIGVEWPQMTHGERELMLANPGTEIPFVPTTRRGHG